MHRRSFALEWQKLAETLEARAHQTMAWQTMHYNLTTKALPALSVCDHVVIQDTSTKRWITPVVVVDTGDFRDYFIKTAARRVFRRNRRFLRQRFAVMPEGYKPMVGMPQIAPPTPPTAREPEETPELSAPQSRDLEPARQTHRRNRRLPPQEAVGKSTRMRTSPQ